MNAKQIWQTTIQRLQTKVPPAVFTTWFQGTTALSFQDGVFVVGVPTTFAKAHLEGRFLEVIRSNLIDVTGGPVEVQILVAKDISGEQDGISSRDIAPLPHKRPYRLPKSRLSALQRSQQNLVNPQEGLPPVETVHPAIAMNSLAPAPVRPSAHRNMNTGDTNDGRNEQDTRMPPFESRLQRDAHDFSPGQPPSVSPLHSSGEYTERLIGPALLNTRYTFDTFIVGKCNQLAHAASLAASENPGHIYNPLFFYGGVGLGKTHLLHAVGHVGESAGLNVLYVTSEKFTNEIVNAIRYQKTEEFRTKYREIDILLVDDIQFIAGKESTEEEFFHTFNTLYDAHKQIVVTSDRPPKAIHSLQDRLRSRFEWGLLADIQPPEYEHRLAILRSKAESLRFVVPNAVIEFIARPECSNVRELEGSLNRVIAFATLQCAPLSVSLAAQALEHIYKHTTPLATFTVLEVLEGVSRFYNVDIELLKGKQRDREIVWPRQVAMYVMREQTNASLFQVGIALGGRDHTTIMHGWEKVQAEIANNDRVRREIAALLETLQQR
ncbi:MAG TPA: chromosomal replication initiator protein DnaA [Ktedonobacteraceae bacterium]|nr:chromosomal replication initiator protein DnaA [Ktedonobacteraceae bacterium]